MAGGKPILALIALILIAGGILLDIFIVLSGTHINTTPINKIYFLSAATTGMGNAPATSAWTYFSICSLTGSTTSACRAIAADPPFDPVRNFGTTTGIPAPFVGSNFWYYMSRVAWAFFLIALFFAVCTLALGIFACCARIAGFLSGFFAFCAMGAQAVAAALMTAWTVRARNAFQGAGHSATLGRYGYGFTWAAFLCFFLAMILFCTSGGRRSKNKNVEEEEVHQDMQQHQHIEPVYQPPVVRTEPVSTYQPPPAPPPEPVYQRPEPVYQSQPEPVYHQQQTNVEYDPQPISYQPPLAPVPAPAGGGFFVANTGMNKNRESGVKDEYS